MLASILLQEGKSAEAIDIFRTLL